MSYKLEKPYTETEYADFVVLHSHTNGRLIEETDTAIYALEPNEIMQEGLPVVNPDYEQEQAEKEALRKAQLNLTAADVERAIYKAKGIDFDDVITLIEAQPLSEDETPTIDIKALKIELKANNFYRGNPYIDAVGTLLGFTSEQLDEFFETNDYTKLLTPVVTEPDSGTDDTKTNSAGETTEDETATVSGTDGAATAEDEE